MFARSYFAERYFALRYFAEFIDTAALPNPICSLNVAVGIGSLAVAVDSGSLHAQSGLSQINALFRCIGRIIDTPARPPTDYVLFFSFDAAHMDYAGGHAYDQSSNAFVGTFAGSGPAPTSTSAQVNAGISFNSGTDASTGQYIDCGRVAVLEGQQKQSWSYWFKLAPTNGGPFCSMVKGYSDGNNATETGPYDGQVYFGSNSNYGSFAHADLNLHHVVWLFDGSQSGNAARLVCYFDNALQPLTFNGTIGSLTTTTTDNFYIGRYAFPDSDTDVRSGAILDQLRVYNRVLTPAEIAALYAEA